MDYAKPKKSRKRKLVYSAIASAIFFGGLFSLEAIYRHHQKATLNPVYVVEKHKKLNYEKPENREEGIFYIAWFGASTSMLYPQNLEWVLNDEFLRLNKKTRFSVTNTSYPKKRSDGILEDLKGMPFLDMAIYGPEWNDAIGCKILEKNEHIVLAKYFSGESDENALRALGDWYSNNIEIFRKEKTYWDHKKGKYLDSVNKARQKLHLLDALPRPTNKESYIHEKQDGVTYRSHMADFPPDHTHKNMESFINISGEKGAKHIILSTTPDAIDAYPTSYRGCFLFLNINDLHSYIADSLNPMVRELAKNNGVSVLDLEKKFNELGERKKDYFLEFMHPNEKGGNLILNAAYKVARPLIDSLP